MVPDNSGVIGEAELHLVLLSIRPIPRAICERVLHKGKMPMLAAFLITSAVTQNTERMDAHWLMLDAELKQIGV